MVAWPALLPRPTFDGYTVKPDDPSLRSDMELGAPRVRRRTAARNDQVNVTWRFTDREMAVFRAWFDGSAYAAGGTAWFDVTLAKGDIGLRSVSARFVGAFEDTLMAGMIWQVSAKLEIRGGELTSDQIKGAVLGLISASGVYPSLVLDFAGDKALDPRVTFTRSTTATYFDASGVMQTAAINAPRFDHDPVTGESLGLLIEERRTNLLLNSAALSTQGVTATATAYTLTFWGTGTVTLSGVSTAGPLVGTGASTRVSLTFTPTAGTLTLTVSGTVSQAQLEAGAFATSYIPTTDAAVTRAADVATMTGANYASWWSNTSGTIFADFDIFGAGSANECAIWQADDGTLNNRHVHWSMTTLKMGQATYVGGVAQSAITSVGSVVSAAKNKTAYAYSANDFASSYNTEALQTDTAGTLPTCTGFKLGTVSPIAAGVELNGHIRRLAYYPSRLPDADLVALTA